MFCLDALLVIEMIQNKKFPGILNATEEDLKKIEKREFIYDQILKSIFENENILKKELLKEHV